ncbi:MAG: TonB-dependent receptor [Thermodesulfovibrio sp.]|nr:TonB-dependent receptor [Thermodesulfovibrio sp.]MDW7972444.1 TonB-dependent receptor [Thermodesulfovibrio sp.]
MIYLIFLTLSFILFSLNPAKAEQKDEVKLEEIVVTATKTERELKEVSTNVTVITKEDIEKYDARDVSELLRQIPGFNISFFGGVHADVYVSSRGNVPLTRGAQILVNGIEYNNPSGYVNVLAIPIGDIERIEIIKSPVTSLYGNFATGGVINIITKKPLKPVESTVNLSYGSFDTQRYSAVLKGSLNKVEYYLEGRFYKTHGWQDNSWEENKLFNTMIKYTPDKSINFGLHFNYAPIENGYPGPLSESEFKENPRQTKQPWGKADSYTLVVAPYFEKNFENSKILLKVKYGMQDGWCIDPDYFDFRNYNVVPEINYFLYHKIGNIEGILLIGAEYRYLNNEKIKAYKVVNGIRGPLYQDRTWKDNTFGIFVQEEITPFKDLTVSFGIRYDRVKTNFKDKIKPSLNFEKTHSALSPKIGFAYNFSNSFNLFMNYSRGFRNPTTAITGFADNPDLKPEKINSYEVGFRGDPLPWLNYNIALFLVDTKDKIVRVGGPRKVENAGEIRAKGIEIGLDIDFQLGFYGSLNYTFQESEFRKYTTVAGISYKGNEIPLVPKHLLGLSLGYRAKWFGNLVLIANYSSKRFIDVANTKTLEDYFIIDAKYSRQINKHLELFLSGKNLTDKRYVEIGFGGPGWEMLYPMPGRSIIGGVNLYF